MEHKTLSQIRGLSEGHSVRLPSRTMSRHERLERWIELLERDPTEILETLPGTEYQGPEIRYGMRRLNSAVTIAYRDPVLRSQGLRDDTYGEARRFFRLSDEQLHSVVCYCQHGTVMTARQAAWRLRLMTRRSWGAAIADGIRRIFTAC